MYAIASDARKMPEAWSWRLNAVGMMSPSPKPIIVQAGTRYTNWCVPAT